MARTSTRRFIGSAIAFVAMVTTSFAQNNVDIGLFHSDGMLEVRVRPQSDFDGIFSSLVFTIRWERSGGATLGQLAQEPSVQQYMALTKSGNFHEDGPNNYQVYAGFGVTPMNQTGTTWAAGQEYTLARIPFTGNATFELVNDPWTHDPGHNADYYVSLGGRNKTGEIYKALTSADEDGSVSILPNPNNGQFTFSFTNASAVDVTVEVVNNLGQTVMTDVKPGFEGTYRREMDLTSTGRGVYYLKIKRPNTTSVHKIVYR